jgi:hypothetical protein
MRSRHWLCLMFVTALSMNCMAGIPVIYSTDLFHPFDDPDDHYDLATLFALPELDVKGVIIDRSNIREQRTYQSFPKRPGIVALQQMSFLSGREVPIALGLTRPLSSAEDTAEDQPESSLQGVNLILSTLRNSEEKVALFTVGSLVDVAAAYNRDPELLHRKVSKLYVNAGTGPDGSQEEWNVRLDPHAYRRVMLSGLPIEWYPCFGRDQYFTHFIVDQPSVLGTCDDSLRAFFAYAFQHSKKEPISFLSGIYPPPKGPRNMWCTAAFIDLSGRDIYATPKGYEALPEPPTSNARPVSCYEMCPVVLTLAEGDEPGGKPQSGLSSNVPAPNLPCFRADLEVTQSTIHVLKKQEPDYTTILTSCMTHILNAYPLAGQRSGEGGSRE